MNKYTPTADEVRDAFAGKGKGYANSSHYERQGSEFDRWLDEHDRQVKAEAWEEGQDEGTVAAINFTPLPPNPYRAG